MQNQAAPSRSRSANEKSAKRHWPPRWISSESEATRLAQRPQWQPAVWQRALVMLAVLWFIAPASLEPAHAQAEFDSISTGTLVFKTDALHIEAPRVHTDVTMQITGIIARVTVTQRFRNPSESWVEGLYAFPLPDNAAVDRLRMVIGESLQGVARAATHCLRVGENARW